MRVFLSILLASWFAAQAGLASDECNVRRIADVVKTISILRQVENSLNALALAQADAIVDISTGVHTLELYNDESGFYGPLGGARFTNQVHHLIMVVQWEETTASSILTSVLN